MKILSRIIDNQDIASKDYVDSSTSTLLRETVSIVSDNTSVIQIPFNIESVDTLTVYYRGLLLVNNIHYTATTSSITLSGFTASAGDLFTFISGASTSSALPATAVAFSNIQSFGNCTNVDEALEHLSYDKDTVGILAAEASFRSYVNSTVLLYGLDTFCIETFKDSIGIDSTVDDGATIIANYHDSNRHVINKTNQEEMTIQSTTFSVSDTPYRVWVYADYDGTGDVSLYFSKNSGTDWFPVVNDTLTDLTDLNLLVQRSVRIKVVLSGQVRLKNIAWGCK